MSFSIKGKLLGGFLLLNACVAIGGSVAAYLFIPLASRMEQTAITTAQALEVSETLAKTVAALGSSGMRFADVGSPDDYHKTLSLLGDLEKTLTTGTATLTEEADRQHLTVLQTLATRYREQFATNVQRLDERIQAEMDLLRQIEEIETPLLTLLAQHSEREEVRRSFLFFTTARLHANTYLNTHESQDFLELMESLEIEEKILRDGGRLWSGEATLVWQKLAQQVGALLVAFSRFDIGVQALRTDLKTQMTALPDQMRAEANAMAAAQWEQLRGLSAVIKQQTHQVQWVMLIVFGVVLSIGVLLPFFLARKITRPVHQVRDGLRGVAQGDSDLTARLLVASGDEVGELAGWFNTFLDNLHGLVSQVVEVAARTATAAHQLTATADQLSTGAQQQASSLEETTANMEEMTATVKQTAENAQHAHRLAQESRGVAEQGGQIVAAAVASMSEITTSSKRIADISSVIDEVAFQTNLLALNAAVEAARAGEQGRGFAVVAAEVRTLAQRSATAAKEIKGLIQTAGQKVEDGSALVNKSGEALLEIIGSVKRVSDIVAEITVASQEQAQGIGQVNKMMTQMDNVTQSNAAQTEELSSTAQALAVQAQQLQALVGRFKLQENNSQGLSLDMTGPVSDVGESHERAIPVPHDSPTLSPGVFINGHDTQHPNGQHKELT